MSIARRHHTASVVFVVALLSAIGAAILHLVADRSEAPRLLVVTGAWGLFAVLAGSRLPRPTAATLLFVSIAVRAPWIGTPPWLSDDLYRYLFEGLALAAGHDPFREAPATLIGLHDEVRTLVNHPDLGSVYPPLALWWFRFLAIGGTPWFAQAATAAVDATIPLLILAGGRRSSAAWVYALHPLAVVESASGAHVDTPAIALAAAAVVVWERRPTLALWLAGAGGAVKLFPVLLLPTLARRAPPGRAAATLLGVVVAAFLALTALVRPGPELLTSARLYASTWEFSGFVWPWVAPWLGDWGRPILVAVAAGWVGRAALVHRHPIDVWCAAGAVFVLLSPTVHPWYVGWILVPSLLAGRVGWALAAVGSLHAYLVLSSFDPTTGAWGETPETWWWVWGWVLPSLAAGRWLQVRSDETPTSA